MRGGLTLTLTLPLPLTLTLTLTLGAMKRACDEGRGELDFSAVFESQKKPKP